MRAYIIKGRSPEEALHVCIHFEGKSRIKEMHGLNRSSTMVSVLIAGWNGQRITTPQFEALLTEQRQSLLARMFAVNERLAQLGRDDETLTQMNVTFHIDKILIELTLRALKDAKHTHLSFKYN